MEVIKVDTTACIGFRELAHKRRCTGKRSTEHQMETGIIQEFREIE